MLFLKIGSFYYANFHFYKVKPLESFTRLL